MANQFKCDVTKLFLKYLVKESKESFPIKVSEKYLDKDYGTYNSFKVEGLPEYLFGIWWDEETHLETETEYDEDFNVVREEKVEVKYLIGSFFGDYKEEIDKFKPWRCSFNVYIRCKVDELKKLINKEIDYFPLADNLGQYGNLSNIVEKLTFIKNEPELAFNVCWNGWDMQYQYHSRESARNEYNKYIKYKKEKQEQENASLKEQFEYFNNLLTSVGAVQYKDFIVKDENHNPNITVSPRFELFIKCPTSWRDGFKEHLSEWGGYGCYSLFDLLAETKEESEKLYKEYMKFCSNVENKYKHVWYVNDFSTFAVLVTPQRFAKLKVKKNIVDITKPEKYFDTKVYQ